MIKLWMVLFAFSCSAFCVAQNSLTESNITAREVQNAVNQTIEILETDYLYSNRAQRAIEILKLQKDRGEYDTQFGFGRLKHKLENVLINTTSDGNFELVHRPKVLSRILDDKVLDASQSTSEITADLIEGRIGYLRISGDATSQNVFSDIQASAQQLGKIDALILDVRDVARGSIEATQTIAGMFLNQNTVLAELKYSRGRKTAVIKTMNNPIFPAPLPVFLLQSAFVEGPWELLSISLQEIRGARIVGEDSMGIANLTMQSQLSDTLQLTYTSGEFISADDRLNWHQIGVIADHPCSAKESLNKAYELIRSSLTD